MPGAAVRSSSGRRSTAAAMRSTTAAVRSAAAAAPSAALRTLERLGRLRVLALEGLMIPPRTARLFGAE
jgi:hypothetical protein